MRVETSPGRFGPYGGRYVPETLVRALEELAGVYEAARNDPRFWAELEGLLKNYVGRPTPITAVPRLSAQVGAQVLLKREDLNHTGAQKINNTLGQVLLAQRMNKRRIIAETGAGQHGVATATVCARFGLECIVYMGEADMRRQRLNVYRMELMGAKVVPVTSGTRTLKDATNEALRDWVTNVTTTHYIIGSVVGPDPFPRIVRDFQSVIGREARAQTLARWGKLPSTVVACVGGGSNAMGIFSAFLDDRTVALVGVEAAGATRTSPWSPNSREPQPDQRARTRAGVAAAAGRRAAAGPVEGHPGHPALPAEQSGVSARGRQHPGVVSPDLAGDRRSGVRRRRDRAALGRQRRLQPGAARREHRLDALQGRRPLARVQAGRRGGGDRELPGRVAARAQPPGRCRRRPAHAALGAGLSVRQLHVPRARQ